MLERAPDGTHVTVVVTGSVQRPKCLTEVRVYFRGSGRKEAYNQAVGETEKVCMTDYASMRKAIEETKESFDAVERFQRRSVLCPWLDVPLRDES